LHHNLSREALGNTWYILPPIVPMPQTPIVAAACERRKSQSSLM
jgi:hypothetical protein